jgi:CubicO group peptidase (beta-lactamase class C family)
MNKHTFFTALLASFLLNWASSGQAIAQIKAVSGVEIDSVVMDRFLHRLMDSSRIPGLSIAIIRDAKIVYYRTMGYANVDSANKDSMIRVDDKTVFEAGSLTKSVFTVYVLKQVERGVLNLDTPVYKYLPNPDIDYDDRYKLITARMLLDHSSGLPNWRGMNLWCDLDVKFTPGTDWWYSGEGYCYLANVVDRLTHKNLTSLGWDINKEVIQPAGMKYAYVMWDPFLDKHLATGYTDEGKPRIIFYLNTFNAAASLHTEARSYANFLISLMTEKCLKHSTVEEMLRPQIIIKDTSKSEGCFAFGLGIGLIKTPYGIVYKHSGSTWCFQSDYMFDMKRKIGFVVFTNSTYGYDFNRRVEQFLIEGKDPLASE